MKVLLRTPFMKLKKSCGPLTAKHANNEEDGLCYTSTTATHRCQ
ncbi:hypothetical protein FHX09_002625 [Rhizobium sp. BK538]|nr:hypothetical protein [Rhizobium sp. BK538]